MKEYTIQQLSNTQKIILTVNEDGSWFLSKQWRRDSFDNWKIGKGIVMPQSAVDTLSHIVTGMENCHETY